MSISIQDSKVYFDFLFLDTVVVIDDFDFQASFTNIHINIRTYIEFNF